MKKFNMLLKHIKIISKSFVVALLILLLSFCFFTSVAKHAHKCATTTLQIYLCFSPPVPSVQCWVIGEGLGKFMIFGNAGNSLI